MAVDGLVVKVLDGYGVLAQDIYPGHWHAYQSPEPNLVVHAVRVAEPGQQVWIDFSYVGIRSEYFTPWNEVWRMHPAEPYLINELELT